MVVFIAKRECHFYLLKLNCCTHNFFGCSTNIFMLILGLNSYGVASVQWWSGFRPSCQKPTGLHHDESRVPREWLDFFIVLCPVLELGGAQRNGAKPTNYFYSFLCTLTVLLYQNVGDRDIFKSLTVFN